VTIAFTSHSAVQPSNTTSHATYLCRSVETNERNSLARDSYKDVYLPIATAILMF